jgi:cytoskeletal protein RodZ
MPALFAYIVSVGIFLGSGYFGLNFLAGAYEKPPQFAARSSTSGHQQKRQRANTEMQAATPAPTPKPVAEDVSVEAAATPTPQLDEAAVKPAEPEDVRIDNAALETKTPTSDEVAPAVQIVADAPTVSQARAELPKAKTTQTVKNVPALREAAVRRTPPKFMRRVATTRTTKPKPALVKMVLQTIEFPDGRREERLVTLSQARSSD